METPRDLLNAARNALAQGDVAAAVRGFLDAAAKFPRDKTVAYTAAAGLRACGDERAAAGVLEQALRASPTSVALLQAVAEVYTALGMTDEAANRLTRAMEPFELEVAATPESVSGWINIGKLRTKLGQSAEAGAAFGRAIGILFERAQVQSAAGQIAAAEDSLRQILSLDPAHEPARTLLHDSVKARAAQTIALLQFAWTADKALAFGEAREVYENVLRQSPGHAFALARLLTMDGIEGRLDDADTHHRLLVSSLAESDLTAISWMHLAVVAYQAVLRPLPQTLYKSMAAEIDRQLLAEAKPQAPRKTRPSRAGRRLRVGYLSTLFRDHPVGHVTAEMFAAHDRTRFEVHVFYLPDGAPTAFTRTIAAGAEHFIPLPGTADAMIREIAARDLDILIYIDGYMAPALLPVVAARTAPLQIYWLGHAGNCDISGIDYLIADTTVVPPEDEPLYTARVVRLPVTYHCASPHPIAGELTRAAAGLPAEGFVFCAFNNPEKIDRTIFDAWMRILARVEGSVLWLSQTLSPAVAHNLRAAAAARGIDGARLIFAARLPDKAEHLPRHRLCGLFLDTLALNASTTALDALWSGLPLLTVPGPRFGSRIAASFLRALGLDDLIVPTLEAYEARAVHLATHPEELGALRARLAANRESRPLFKIEAFCRALEACLDRIHQDHIPAAAP
ncbi:MAG: O-linked N-acetylglucosamine transferase, SPINDLY family protein [Rhodospirillaceae bacterium]